MLNFGTFIREKRLEKGYTLRKFSDAVKMNAVLLSALERDEIPCDEDYLFSIAHVLDIDRAYVYFLNEITPRQKKKPLTLKQLGYFMCSCAEHEEVA